MENREEERKLLDAAGVEGRVLSMKDGGQAVSYTHLDVYKRQSLDSAGHFAGTQAAGAGVHALGSAVDNSLNALDVGLPSPVGTTMGVGNLNAKGHVLAAEITFCHKSICTPLKER